MKGISWEQHGTFYYLEDYALCCCPMLQNGGYDEEAKGIVEESPTIYKSEHEEILGLLGVEGKDIDSYTDNISYYEE